MKLSAAVNNGKPCWRVSYQLDGKNHRRFFRFKGDAETFVSDHRQLVRKHGEQWLAIPTMERWQLMACLEQAKAGGYTLFEACRFWEQTHKTTDAPNRLPPG
jgi:hypothetical protein